MNLLLVGSPGTGKTAIAYELQQLGWQAADITQILAKQGISDKDFTLREKTEYLHQKEIAVAMLLLQDITDNNLSQRVIALPSAIFNNVDDLADSKLYLTIRTLQMQDKLKVVQLNAELSKLIARNGLMGARWAFVMPRRIFRELHTAQSALYASFADFSYDTTQVESKQAASDILQQIDDLS